MRQLLSQRRSGSGPDGPYDGVPKHLQGPLIDWLSLGVWNEYLGFSRPPLLVSAIQLRIPVPEEADAPSIWRRLTSRAKESEEFLLDWIDSSLPSAEYDPHLTTLEGLLRLGGSIYTVNKAERSLEVLTSDEQRAAKDLAAAPTDPISDELSKAWAHAYGRNPDPSDAWDHAIKAVEACLVPIVCPNDSRATLGSVLGQLRAAGTAWKSVLIGGSNQTQDATRLTGMLEFLWPNPDRHGGANTRTPTLEEAQAVVNLAVTIVQWHRAGRLVTR